MIRTIWGDPERFAKAYFPAELGGHLYLAGDGAIRDAQSGYFTIMGRIDDVLNVSGHRLGTMEIESALVANPLVAEAAVRADIGMHPGDAVGQVGFDHLEAGLGAFIIDGHDEAGREFALDDIAGHVLLLCMSWPVGAGNSPG
jgi:acyl-CoA synthetase (AMP-forming)/AMP-acid ligase II